MKKPAAGEGAGSCLLSNTIYVAASCQGYLERAALLADPLAVNAGEDCTAVLLG